MLRLYSFILALALSLSSTSSFAQNLTAQQKEEISNIANDKSSVTGGDILIGTLAVLAIASIGNAVNMFRKEMIEVNKAAKLDKNYIAQVEYFKSIAPYINKSYALESARAPIIAEKYNLLRSLMKEELFNIEQIGAIERALQNTRYQLANLRSYQINSHKDILRLIKDKDPLGKTYQRNMDRILTKIKSQIYLDSILHDSLITELSFLTKEQKLVLSKGLCHLF